MGAEVILDKFPAAWNAVGGGVVGGAVGAGGSLLSSGLGAVAMSNPYMAAFSAVVSLFGGSSTNISKAQAQGQSYSGLANFENDDQVSLGGGRILDFSDPKQILMIGGAVVLAVYVFKKVKK